MSDQALQSCRVFISYSSKDKKWADGACAVLEKHRIRCWIAPRDILPGTEWGAAIIKGIEACRIMVLIFSADANVSPNVRREVERAIQKEMILLPFRVENVLPSGALEFALSSTNWLDGFTPPMERQLERLAESVMALIPGGQSGSPAAPVRVPRRLRGRLLVAAGGIAIAMAASTGGYFLNRVVGEPESTPDMPLTSSPTKVAERVPKNAVGPPVTSLSDVPRVVVPQPERAPMTPPSETKKLKAGVNVRVKEKTIAYSDEGTGQMAATVEVGRKGEVLRAPLNGSRCLVRFDLSFNGEVWVPSSALEAE